MTGPRVTVFFMPGSSLLASVGNKGCIRCLTSFQLQVILVINSTFQPNLWHGRNGERYAEMPSTQSDCSNISPNTQR